ncbi:unnamed protein product [Tenebrio molitor]|nr:unnamed protein product [Tenebrio molitor]
MSLPPWPTLIQTLIMTYRSELRILLSSHFGFGRFPILNTGISLKIEKVQWIILATAVLLNMACGLKNKIYHD